MLERDVTAFDIAAFTQTGDKCFKVGAFSFAALGMPENPDAMDLGPRCASAASGASRRPQARAPMNVRRSKARGQSDDVPSVPM